MQLKFRPSTARGNPCGCTHHRVRHSDAVVAEAKALRLKGWTFAAIAHTLGVPLGTVEAWTAGRRRNRAPVRVIVQRVKGPSDAEAARVIVQRVKAPPSTSSGFSVP